jgi:AcrR family transcriptional regulator
MDRASSAETIDKPRPDPPRPGEQRGRHAERTAAVLQRLIDAAIGCLHRVGYAAVSTQMVAEEAGVSRGAMLHHFLIKVDLISAVAEAAIAHQDRCVRQRLSKVRPGIDRFLAITVATSEALREPPAIALIEITVAARSDPVLGARLPTLSRMFEAGQRDAVWEMARAIEMHDQGAVDGPAYIARQCGAW